jgi:hypothetical protein
MLVFLIILLLVFAGAGMIMYLGNKASPEARLGVAIVVLGIMVFSIYTLEMRRKSVLKDGINNFVIRNNGTLKSTNRVTSDGAYSGGSRKTDINSYYRIEFVDGRKFIIGFEPELFGEYFGSLVLIKAY